MRNFRNAVLLAMAVVMMTSIARADNEYWYRSGDSPDIEVWTNKGENSDYYYGEDIAVYLRADEDCYAVVYDIDPAGEVNVLFPSGPSGSSFVAADRVYRIPGTDDDFRMEVSGNSGREHIFAVASFDYINSPDFMKYVGYNYGDDNNYDDSYFVPRVRGNLDDFVTYVNNRITTGSYSVAHARFNIDTRYRHHSHYRYWDYDPYNIGSVWIGSDWPGSEIWIDGVFYGIAPVFVPRVIFGYHWVWVYYGGYPCYQHYFYVPAYQRYSINVRIDQRFKDHRYRRNSFRGWVFDEKKYRNEGDFRERAREAHDKNVRTRSLPPSIIRDYAERGVIAKDSPLAKQVRSNTPERDRRIKPDLGADKPQPPIKIERPRGIKGEDHGRDMRERKPSGYEKPDRSIDADPGNAIPETPRKIERAKPFEGKPAEKSDHQKVIEKRHDSRHRESKSVEMEQSKKRESAGESPKNVIEKEKSVKSDNHRNSDRWESHSSKRSGNATEKKGRRK